MTIDVYLTTDLAPDVLRAKRIRRRRRIARGSTIRFRGAFYGDYFRQTLFVDDKPVAYVANDGEEWHEVEFDRYWGNGLAFEIKET